MKQLFYLVFLCLFSVQAQAQVSGRIVDGVTKKSLPFASISTATFFTTADLDGNFTLNSSQVTDSISVSYVGYESQRIFVGNRKNVLVKLSPASEKLREVTVGKNPAIPIIEKAIANKNQNDPENKLRFFQFDVYNKLVITANPDSINGTIDSIFVTNRRVRKFIKLDSTEYVFKKIISKRHIYQTEKISQVQFDGSHRKETVEATKMAGFKKPIYELIGLRLQSFSIYNNQYELLENRYNGPLGSTALKDYSYQLLDTLSIQSRKVFIVYFADKKSSSKNGLNGVLYIDAENYGVAKAVLRVKSIIDVRATHEYQYFADYDLWFPNARTFKIIKGNSKDNIKIFGGQIEFSDDSVEDAKDLSEKKPSDFIELYSKSVYYNHEFNKPLEIPRKTLAIQVKEDAIEKSDLFWQRNRKDTLDFRGIETYKSLDSLVISRGIEKKLNIGRRILDGYLPVSIVDLDLRYLIKYNNFEGFRFGIGGITNDKLSEVFKLDGYAAYGIKNERLKYKYGGLFRVGKPSNTWIGASYTDDLREIASTSFAIDKRVFKIYDPRPINVSTFYNYKQIRGFVQSNIIPKTESIWEISQTKVEPAFRYTFNYKDRLYRQYTLTTFMLSLQWNPFSDFMLTPSGRLEIEKNYPKFTFQIIKSLPDFGGSDFNYTKFDLRIDLQKKFINGQKTSLYAEFGCGIGDIPLTHLYNMSPNNLNNDNILQRLTIAGKNSFETMFFNEFFSSSYVLFQVKHSLQRVTLFKKVKPSLVLVSRIGWGIMQKPQQHLGVNYKTLDEGYFESGIELNKIYKGFGLASFYRYGPNQLARFEDNIAIKATFQFDLGF